jgi:hypothetical protein
MSWRAWAAYDRDHGDVHLAAFEMDEKQHAVGYKSSQLWPSYPGCIINMSGYDFRKRQVIIPALWAPKSLRRPIFLFRPIGTLS